MTKPDDDRTCTPCALAHDRRTPATHVATGPGPGRPLQWWSCTPCAETGIASGAAARIEALPRWFARHREKWDAADTVAALKGRPLP